MTWDKKQCPWSWCRQHHCHAGGTAGLRGNLRYQHIFLCQCCRHQVGTNTMKQWGGTGSGNMSIVQVTHSLPSLPLPTPSHSLPPSAPEPARSRAVGQAWGTDCFLCHLPWMKGCGWTNTKAVSWCWYKTTLCLVSGPFWEEQTIPCVTPSIGVSTQQRRCRSCSLP